MFTTCQWLVASVLLIPALAPAEAAEAAFHIGVAKIDITPEYPIRLTGYAVRKTESEGVEQRLWAKALAISGDAGPPAVLVTVDNCGVCANVTDDVAARLKAKMGLPRDRLAICSSHTHAGPCTVGFAPNIFAMPIPADQLATIERYTRELTDKLEQVVLTALANRQPARLAWTEGKVDFARNRRTTNGPTDPALPVLAVTALDGKLRAILANYACHCTTIGGEFNKTCGDWAGFAQEEIEHNHPGALALISIGCGADANPHPRGGPDIGLALAKRHGQELAAEVKRLVAGTMTPIHDNLSCRARTIELPFDKLPTREQWIERAKESGIVGYHAKRNLERLDRGESLPTTLPYFVQAWNFGDQLAMVFLGGEVVVDYAIRLKKEFDPSRLWVTAYANHVPCYIPSRRILQEGGYEAETSLWYYDRPARLAPSIEDLIDSTVVELLPAPFRQAPGKADISLPMSPEEALAAFSTKAGLNIELAASEPLVVDPVAIDWGPDGRLWVAEMRDYPGGMDGHWKPGGRVKVLEDMDRHGRYTKATVFLDNLPFPTGVMAWNKGILVCAAPDILYAEDTDGDGHADKIEKLFSGFATNNYQARVNGLSLGLDNWIHGANGLIGGNILRFDRRVSGPTSVEDPPVNISGRDFRMHPDTGEFEPAAGLTQQGRVRDDWGNWFGCDNGTLVWHYPLPDHYARRNHQVGPAETRQFVPADPDPNQLFPTSRTLERFNDPQSANRTTSACGLGIYRDDLLGSEFAGDAFICEPVHNLVHRLSLKRDGVTFSGWREPDEQRVEFLSSTDNWFRPVQARTGPDGALYIVDMYRFVVEHPRWIPPERLAKLDVRAGEDRGRIYRMVPVGQALRRVRDLTGLSAPELALALDSPNGTERDRVHLELLRRHDPASVAPLIALFKDNAPAVVRAQTLCVLEGLNALTPGLAMRALNDKHPAVRCQAIRLSERFVANEAVPQPDEDAALDRASPDRTDFPAEMLRLAADPDITVRYQLALSLGACTDPRAGTALGQLARDGLTNTWMRAAVISSATRFPVPILKGVLDITSDSSERTKLIEQLITTAGSSATRTALYEILSLLAPADPAVLESWRLSALTSLIDAFERSGIAVNSLSDSAPPPAKDAARRVESSLEAAEQIAKSIDAQEGLREAAILLVGRSNRTEETLPWLAGWLHSETSLRLQMAAVSAIARTASPNVPENLLRNWPQHSPSMRELIVSTLLSRDEWSNGLLCALERGSVKANELTLSARQRLLRDQNADVRQRAAALFGSGQTTGRAEVLARYRPVEHLKGNLQRGAAVYETNCSACHALGGRGHAVGPDLTVFQTKAPQDFLVAILDPNAAIEPRFIGYQIETRDGRSLSGIVKTESGTSLILAQGGGLEEKVLRGDITGMKASELSPMPEGLEQNIGLQEMADLIAWLKQSGPAANP